MSRSSFHWAGHSHVCRETGEGTRSLDQWAAEMQRRGLHYFGFGHPWEPDDLAILRHWELDPGRSRSYHDEKIWKTRPADEWTRSGRFSMWRRNFSTDRFTFGVDLETPKVRYGHLWWIGWEPDGLAPWHDSDKPWTAWETSPARIRGEPPPPFQRRWPAEVIRVQRAAGALPVYAHPTSWWTGPGGCHISNIATTLVPDLLTGQCAGCLVVMGYDADHRSYQKLWFELLDKGYFLTAVAETDACLDFEDPFPRGLHHNIASVEQPGLNGLREALIRGRNVMTTGPVLDLSCGDQGPGGHVAAGGGEIRVSTSGLRSDSSYRIEILHCGRVCFERQVSSSESASTTFAHEGSGWVLARLLNTSDRAEAALTNPIFFGPEPQRVTGRKLPAELFRWWEVPGAEALALYLAAGEWQKDFPGRNPGEVPFAAFRWDDWLRILGNQFDTYGEKK